MKEITIKYTVRVPDSEKIRESTQWPGMSKLFLTDQSLSILLPSDAEIVEKPYLPDGYYVGKSTGKAYRRVNETWYEFNGYHWTTISEKGTANVHYIGKISDED